jgi:hypothetical protein
VQGAELWFQIAQRLGAPKEQDAFGLEGKVQRAEHLLLKLRLQVDQQIAAGPGASA